MKKEHTNATIGTIVDMNGVILGDIYEGDRILHYSQNQYLENNIINFNRKEAFVKVFINPILSLYLALPTKEFSIAMGIMPFISYKDGILRHEGKIADMKTISDILNENYDNFRKHIKNLIQYQVLARIERPSDVDKSKTRQCLVVNPYIYLRGQDIEKDIVNVFASSPWVQSPSSSIE